MPVRAFLRCCLLLALALADAALACSKTMRWSEDPPFTTKRADGLIVGFEIEIAREALHRMGCRLVPVEMLFGRGLKELEAGRLDMAGSAFRRPEREHYAWYAQPVLNSRNRLYVRKDALPGFKARSLREWFEQGHKIGIQAGVHYGPELSEVATEPRFQAQLQHASKRAALWRMLERGRIDGLIVDEGSAANEIRLLRLEAVADAAPLTITREPSHTIFSKRSTELEFVERYNAALGEMAKDGSLKEILARYGLRP